MPPKPATNNVQEVTTLNDITSLILTNAEVLFAHQRDLKVVSGQSQSGLIYYTSIVASDPKSASVHQEYKVILNGPGGEDRRGSMMALLDEIERKVGREVLRK